MTRPFFMAAVSIVGFAIACGIAGCSKSPGPSGSPASSESPASTAAQAEAQVALPVAAPLDDPLAASPLVRQADDDGSIRLTFEQLKFDFQIGAKFQREMLTPEIEQLAGRRVRLRGYLFPSGQSQVSAFTLVEDNQRMSPYLFPSEAVVVRLSETQVLEFTQDPIEVEGIFSIDVLTDDVDGSTLAVYRLDADVADVRTLARVPQ